VKASLISLPAILLAAIAFVVLYVIIGIPLWVSFVVAGGAFLLWTLASGGALFKNSGHAQH
jgi:hypothetical protein